MKDGTIKIWNTTIQNLGRTLTGHTQTVTSLKILTSDGSILASGSEDKSIIIWNLKTYTIIKKISSGKMKY